MHKNVTRVKLSGELGFVDIKVMEDLGYCVTVTMRWPTNLVLCRATHAVTPQHSRHATPRPPSVTTTSGAVSHASSSSSSPVISSSSSTLQYTADCLLYTNSCTTVCQLHEVGVTPHPTPLTTNNHQRDFEGFIHKKLWLMNLFSSNYHIQFYIINIWKKWTGHNLPVTWPATTKLMYIVCWAYCNKMAVKNKESQCTSNGRVYSMK